MVLNIVGGSIFWMLQIFHTSKFTTRSIDFLNSTKDTEKWLKTLFSTKYPKIYALYPELKIYPTYAYILLYQKFHAINEIP